MKSEAKYIEQIKGKSERVVELKEIISKSEAFIQDELDQGPAADREEVDRLEGEITAANEEISTLEAEMSELAYMPTKANLGMVIEGLNEHKSELTEEMQGYSGAIQKTDDMLETENELTEAENALKYNTETLGMITEIEKLEAELESLNAERDSIDEDFKDFAETGAYYIPDEYSTDDVDRRIGETQKKLDTLMAKYSERKINFGNFPKLQESFVSKNSTLRVDEETLTDEIWASSEIEGISNLRSNFKKNGIELTDEQLKELFTNKKVIVDGTTYELQDNEPATDVNQDFTADDVPYNSYKLVKYKEIEIKAQENLEPKKEEEEPKKKEEDPKKKEEDPKKKEEDSKKKEEDPKKKEEPNQQQDPKKGKLDFEEIVAKVDAAENSLTFGEANTYEQVHSKWLVPIKVDKGDWLRTTMRRVMGVFTNIGHMGQKAAAHLFFNNDSIERKMNQLQENVDNLSQEEFETLKEGLSSYKGHQIKASSSLWKAVENRSKKELEQEMAVNHFAVIGMKDQMRENLEELKGLKEALSQAKTPEEKQNIEGQIQLKNIENVKIVRLIDSTRDDMATKQGGLRTAWIRRRKESCKRRFKCSRKNFGTINSNRC
ncbi:MAG: hypothetical protein K6D97_07990 [Clostridia bacterium]|nr:hypothetical protein [Clostridia bacterium]